MADERDEPDDIARLLEGTPPAIASLTRDLAVVIGRAQPSLSLAVRFGWRSINFRHPRAGLLCAVVPLKHEVKLYFEQGRLLSNDSGLLEGEGKKMRVIRLRPGNPIPQEAITLLLAEAIALKT